MMRKAHTQKLPAVTPGAVILIIGADDGARTRDPQLGKLMLYQLSYVRKTERRKF